MQPNGRQELYDTVVAVLYDTTLSISLVRTTNRILTLRNKCNRQGKQFIETYFPNTIRKIMLCSTIFSKICQPNLGHL